MIEIAFFMSIEKKIVKLFSKKRFSLFGGVNGAPPNTYDVM